jgi:hypothetical protein
MRVKTKIIGVYSNHLRIPDGTEGREPTADHTIYHLLSERLVRNNDQRLSVELLDQTPAEFHHVRFSMLACV